MGKTEGALPEWLYEALGTMFFTMMMCSAWNDGSNLLSNSMSVGISWALVHSIFNSHTDAHFNPLLTLASWVKGDSSDFLRSLKLIFGQYVGCAFGIGALARLSSDADQLATAHTFGGKQELVMLFVLAAFLVKFFWAEGGKNFYGDYQAVWYAVAIAVVHMIGGSESDSHMANPAVYTSKGMHTLVRAVLDTDVSADSFDVFKTFLLQNLVLFAGAMVSVLVSKWSYKN